MSVVLLVLAAFVGLLVVKLLLWRREEPELRWDWSGIDVDEARFPPDFLWGAATAAHQVEGGCDNNNWSRWENSVDAEGRPRIKRGQKAGAACEHWTRYREDIELLRELGVGAYRLSVEWSKLEPAPMRFDAAAIRHYHDVLDALLEAGIEPVVTLHHFTHPLWLEELGGFERVENVRHVVAFGERVFREYSDKVRMWCTTNEPEVVAAMGYAAGIFPPGKRSLQAAAEVLKNLCVAHTELYHAIKAMPGGAEARVGIVKNLTQLDPWNRWSPLDWLACRVLNRLFNGAILEYLETGRFRFVIPGLARVDHEDERGARSLDYFGLNYYSHVLLQVRPVRDAEQMLRYRPGDVKTDMPYASYPEGFYRALMRVSRLGVPLYVTENGIADGRDDRRAGFIERYLYALWRAMQDGCDVRGYFYWSLMDNFEWSEGYDMKFGLYEVDFATQRRRLRSGAAPFVRAAGRGKTDGTA
jgi:beta-glucosidase